MKVLLFANTDWYLYNFRLPLARFLQQQGAEVVLLSPPGAYVERLQTSAMRWREIPMQRRSLNPWREARLLQTITRVYREENPDLVHHFTIKCVVYGSLAARRLGIARINAVTGLGHVFTSDSLRSRLLRPLVRRLLRYALSGQQQRLIVQNPDDEAALRDAGLVSTAMLRLIRGSGVDTQRFHPLAERSNPRLRVLLATRLLREKGIEEYVQAAENIQRRGLNAEFLLAGAPDFGNPSSLDEQQITQWQQQGWIQYLGHCDAMEQLLPTVDIAVLPSYREGLPRILLEAAACGLPIVATDVPGCREIVSDEHNGLLTPVCDVSALTEAIARLLSDAGLRARFGHAGRELAVRCFEQEIVLQQTFAVYRELLGNKA